MKLRKLFTQWILVLSMLVLAACGGSPTISDDSAVETIVAGTLVALTQAAPQATEEVVTTNIEFENIRFFLDDQLATGMSYEITAADDPIAEPDNPVAEPSYYQFNFEGFVAADEPREYPISWRQPRLFVLPVEGMQSFPNGGYQLEALSQLQNILSTKPTDIAEKMPLVPSGSINFNNGESYHSNLRYIDFQNGSGIRFLTEFAQFPHPIGKLSSYIYQGLTNDGKYYVSLVLPFNQTALDEYNAPYDQANIDPDQSKAFWENFDSYLLGAIAILETTPDSSFTPDLGKLDALIESLIVKP